MGVSNKILPNSKDSYADDAVEAGLLPGKRDVLLILKSFSVIYWMSIMRKV